MADMDEVVAALQSPHAPTRARTLAEVAKFGEYWSQYDAGQLFVPSLNDPDNVVQEKAALALGSMGASGAIHLAAIVAKLSSDAKGVKRGAIQALGMLGPHAISEAGMVEGFLDNADLDLVVEACISLGSLKSTSSAQKLVKKLSSADPDVAAAACAGLAAIDAEADAVGKLLSHAVSRVKVAALTAVTDMGKALSFAAAAAPLVSDADCFVRIAASKLIIAAGAGASSLVPALGKLLGDSNPGVVAAAAMALGGIGEQSSSEITALEAALTMTGEDTSTKMLSAAGVMRKTPPVYRKPTCAAAAALGAMGAAGEKSASKVAECLGSTDWELRAQAASTLGAMGKAGAQCDSKVEMVVDDLVPAVAAAACISLGQMALSSAPTESAASAVAPLLKSKSPVVRSAACKGLGMMGEEAEAHLEAFVQLFQDRAPSVQVEAIKAVAKCGELGQMYASAVCRAMFDGTDEVRITACESLAEMGERGASFREEMEALLEDPSPEVRLVADKTLRSLSDSVSTKDTAALVDGVVDDDGVSVELSYLDPSKPRLPSALLFPGQGSQYVEMLKDVKDLPLVKKMLRKASAILGYDILSICLKGPEAKLTQTSVSQPALLLGGLAALEQLKLDRPEVLAGCQAVAGLSLGEYTALTFAGVFDFETAVGLVKLRGEAMMEAANASPQKMLSVAGLSQETLEKLCQTCAAETQSTCQIANVLFPKGFSCAGSSKAIEKLEEIALKTEGCMQAKQLKVEGAFHTDLMSPAKERLTEYLRKVQPNMKPPMCDVYMNVTGKKISPGCDPAEIVTMLSDQLTSPVQWEPSMTLMIKDGIEEFFECGPQKQLKAMMKRISPDAWKKTTNVAV